MAARVDRWQPRSVRPAVLISGAVIAMLGLGSACAGTGGAPPFPTPAIQLAGAPALGFRVGVGRDPRERRGGIPFDSDVPGPRLPGPGSRVWQQETQREQALEAELDAQTRSGRDPAPASPPRPTPRSAETAAPVPSPARAKTRAPNATPRVIEYRLPDRNRR